MIDASRDTTGPPSADRGRLDPRLRRVAETRKAAFRPYARYGAPVPGLEWLPLGGAHDSDRGDHGDHYECFLLRFAPGAASHPHEHTGYEEFMVLEGELIDADGTVFRAGDFVHFEPGSRHWSHAPAGCLLLVILRGRNRPLE